MSETIERVAQALCAAYGNDWADTPESGAGLHAHDERLPDRTDWRSMARAAIAAMREPTDGMLRAANDGVRSVTAAAAQWRAMVDVALNDGEEHAEG